MDAVATSLASYAGKKAIDYAQSRLLKSLKKDVRKLKNARETKRFIRAPNGYSQQAGTVWDICRIAQGTQETERVGNEIQPTAMHIRLQIRHPQNAGVLYPEGVLTRVMLVRDTQQTEDTNAVITDILNAVNAWSPFNITKRERWNVLMDECYITSPGDKALLMVDKYLKLAQSKKVYYNGTAATDIQRNGLYLVLFTDNGTGGVTDSHRYDGDVLMLYKDA